MDSRLFWIIIVVDIINVKFFEDEIQVMNVL